MTCHELKDQNGNTVGFACSRGSKPLCAVCKRSVSTRLCDYPLRGVKAGKTCDMRLCVGCAVMRGAGVDYCPAHAKLPALQPEGT